jgi:hypothetical protein
MIELIMPSHRTPNRLNKALAQANSYMEWLSIAEEIDTA